MSHDGSTPTIAGSPLCWVRTLPHLATYSFQFRPIGPDRYTGRQRLASSSAYFERYGSFAEAFRELDGFTSEIGDVRLDSVARVLENERKRTSESFQAFGLKVPAAELYRWGSPLLVVIQLYFLLHLNALTSAVAASERRSAPWIGIYNNRLSQTVTVTSAVMLPLAVVVVLQLDGWSSHWLGWLLNGTLVAASTTIGGFTVAALHKIHQESAS